MGSFERIRAMQLHRKLSTIDSLGDFMGRVETAVLMIEVETFSIDSVY